MLKPVLITGASSGIGEATAVHLAHKGFRVYAGARRLEKLKLLEGLGQDAITAVEFDVTDERSIARTSISSPPCMRFAGSSSRSPFRKTFPLRHSARTLFHERSGA